ncbi:hypothetical protein SETIT_7G018900v2 [Setaria italica]|uniref:C2H2-type domain-containing protein n=1 Tax=Setaria italica TaxID=4555 RepID=A0A368RSW8_SETIT|nr:zinc finger protein ZAT5-like [Setaria italica]RCV32640.1 hypothetical protein SETIT_7G018900v2 [Setaria italica]
MGICQPPNFLHLPLPSLVDNPLYYSSLCGVISITSYPSQAAKHSTLAAAAAPSLPFSSSINQSSSLPLPHTHSTLPSPIPSTTIGAMGAGGVREDHQEAGTPPAMAVPPVLVKGKRSKRQRVHAPPVVLSASASASAAPEWSSSAASAATAPAEEESGTSRSDEAASSGGGGCLTEEDEDMALCLMLLAHGVPAAAAVGAKEDEVAVVVAKEARFRSRRPADGAAAGEYVYECKTCNKCFPSFQALGGHRTSHKKPRLVPPPPALTSEDSSSKAAAAAEPAAPSPSLPPTPPPPAESTADATVLAIPVRVPVAPKQEQQDAAAAIVVVATSSVHSKHPRVHECSICGAEFGSGQALGGHMRRHRPLMPAAARDDAPRKEKSLLELDLNMPAPCDEVAAEARAVTSPRFAFDVAERPAAAAPLLFPASAASALVDCHY